MDLSNLRALAEEWREDAERFRDYGADTLATTCERHAEELVERLDTWWMETLTLQEAADETGLSYSAVQKQVARGDVPNAGREGAPRVRRCDLFGDGEGPRLTTEDGSPDVAGEILMRRE